MVGSPSLSAATAKAMASVVLPALALPMSAMVNIGQGPGEVWSWCARGRDRRRGRGLVRQPFLGPGHVTTVQVGDRGPTQAWACARLFGGRVGVTAARWVADVPHAKCTTGHGRRRRLMASALAMFGRGLAGAAVVA